MYSMNQWTKLEVYGGCPSDPLINDFCVLQLIYELGGDSAVHAWRHRLLNSGGTGSQLWWSLLTLPCDTYLWQQWVSGVELPRSWQQLCGSWLSTLLCPWLAPPTLSVWYDTTGDWLWLCLCIAALGSLGFSCGAFKKWTLKSKHLLPLIQTFYYKHFLVKLSTVHI